MTITKLSPSLRFTAEWCRQFVECRSGSFFSAPVTDEGTQEEADGVSGPAVLSLAEIDLTIDAQTAAQHEHLAVLALKIRDGGAGEPDRLALRFVTPSMMRSAGRAHGSRWLVNEVALHTPVGLDELSLLLYRVRRTPRLGRVLEVVESSVEMLEGAADDNGRLLLARSVLEQLEVLDDKDAAAIVLSGCRLRFAASTRSRDERYLALIGTHAESDRPGNLWLVGRKLHEGPDRASATQVEGRPHLLLRYGAPSMRQSVREFIAEVRRRHQPRSNDAAAREKAESFASFVDRQAIQRRQEVIKATFGHHNMPPMVTPVAVEAAGNLEQTIALSDDPPSRFKQVITAMRESIAAIFGVRVPGLRVRLNETDLPDGTYILMLEEIPLASGNVNPKQLFCLATVAQLVASWGGDWKESDLTAAALPDGSGREGCWIPAEHGEKVRSARFETWDAAAYIEAHLRSLLADNLDLFAILDELEQLFSAMEPGEPDAETLLSRLRAAPGGLPRFGEVVRSLLLEQLPIRDLRALTVHYLEVVDALTLDVAEELRRVPTLHAHITRDAAQWRLFTLAEEYEAKIRMGIDREGQAALLRLEPEFTQELLTAVRNEVPKPDGGGPVVLVVEDASLRPFVRGLLVLEFPRVKIVARREIQGVVGLPAPKATISL